MRSHIAHVSDLLTELGIAKWRLSGMLGIYYLSTIGVAMLEGIGLILLVGLLSDERGAGESMDYITRLHAFLRDAGLTESFFEVLCTLTVIFAAVLLVRFALLTVDGVLAAIVRQKLQEKVFERHISGSWAHMRTFRVGDAVGTTTQETMVVSKYLSAVISAIYFAVSALSVISIAVFASPKISLALGLIALPLAGLLFWVFGKQSSLSKRTATLRNEFSADITDRYNGLLQVHVDGNYRFHLSKGLQTQRELRQLEVKIALCGAVVGSFNVLLILIALVGLATWTVLLGLESAPDLSALASISALGLRAAGQVNGAVAQFGNISRLSGSVLPVLEALRIPRIRKRERINERVIGVKLNEVAYRHGAQQLVSDLTLFVKRGSPLILCGRSGAGKTTIASLMSGLVTPLSGSVLYIGSSGVAYDSRDFVADVGFVTQDIYLFRDTLRGNLTSGRNRSDDDIYDALRQVDADGFVRALGGLDAESVEAGRSLSGGQRRRLGIARVLLSGSEVLIFDEVTAGLDDINKQAVISVIERLSRDFVVILISHDELAIPNAMIHSVG